MADSHSTSAGLFVQPSEVPQRTASGYVATTVVRALIEAFPKPKHRAKLVRALAHATCRLGAEAGVIRIMDREPVSYARARADAAGLLHCALDELEMQLFVLETGGAPRLPLAATVAAEFGSLSHDQYPNRRPDRS